MAERGTPPAGWRSAAFETLVDASIDGAWACDRDLRCLYWNPAMERFSALPAIRAVGYGIIDLLAPVADGDAEPAIREVLAGAPTAFSEQRLVATSPSGALLRTQLMPIRLETGEIV